MKRKNQKIKILIFVDNLNFSIYICNHRIRYMITQKIKMMTFIQ